MTTLHPLRPCPHCAKTEHLITVLDHVRCTRIRCNSSTKKYVWNQRPGEDALVAALEELHAIVWGECPALLNEDSGGSGGLDIQIRDLIAQHRGQG